MLWISNLGLRTPQSLFLCVLTRCESVLVSIYCIKEILWWNLRDTLIYCYEKSSWVILVLYAISRGMVVSSFLGPMDCLVICFGLQYCGSYGFYIMELVLPKSKQKVVNYFHNICATVTPVFMSCQSGLYCIWLDTYTSG